MNIRNSVVFFLKQFGRDATLTQYTDDGTTSDYGDPGWSSSTETINCIPAGRKRDETLNPESGTELAVDRKLVTDYDGTINGREDISGRERPDEMTWDGTDYVVFESVDKDDHKELHLQKKRTS